MTGFEGTPFETFAGRTEELHKRSGTSSLAALRASRKSTGHAIQALRWLKDNGPGNADSVAAKIGVPFISVRPRFAQMAKSGWIARTGDTGLSEYGQPQDIYAITKTGAAALHGTGGGA